MKKVDAWEHKSIRILHHDYTGHDWVDDALIHLRDDSLRAEVHHFRKLHKELERKLEEVHITNDHITNLYLELAPCNRRLLWAEATEQVKSQRGEAVQLISPWTFECRRSA